MKKSILGAILGVATVSAVYGQGHVLFSNYLTAPYNQVVWNANPTLVPNAERANQALTAADGVEFQLFFGEGLITDPSLLAEGVIFNISSNAGASAFDPGAGHGPGGFFLNVVQVLPGWAAGETYTFMYKVITDGLLGESDLWQETGAIQPVANPASASDTLPGIVVSVPEPSTFALLGLGSLALLAFRRRE